MSTRTLKRRITRTRKKPTFGLTPEHFKANGVVLWRGRSRHDGNPVALIAVGLVNATDNPKTPNTATVYGLRTDIPPNDNRKLGAVATCGSCPIKKDCYVGSWVLASIYKQLQAGAYPDADITQLPYLMRRANKLRLGGYANPSIVGWRNFGRYVPELGLDWLSYEHDWKGCPQSWRTVSMASTESIKGTLAAHSRGWRAYQVVPVGQAEHTVRALRSQGLQAAVCPYKKAGRDDDELAQLVKQRKSINCHNCPVPCNGTNELSPNVHIVAEVHGNPSILPSRNQRLRVLNRENT